MEGRLKIVSAAACILIPAGAKKRPRPICQGRCRHTAVPPCFAPRLAAGCLAGCRHTRALSRRARPGLTAPLLSRAAPGPCSPRGAASALTSAGLSFAGRKRVLFPSLPLSYARLSFYCIAAPRVCQQELLLPAVFPRRKRDELPRKDLDLSGQMHLVEFSQLADHLGEGIFAAVR